MSTTCVDVVPVDDHEGRREELAVAGFLAGYCWSTRRSYATDLWLFASWCHEAKLTLFSVGRAHLERFGRWMEETGRMRSTAARRLSTLASFYKCCEQEQHPLSTYGPVPGFGTRSVTVRSVSDCRKRKFANRCQRVCEPPAMRNGPEFVRLQATHRGRLGVEVGIFVAVDHLRRADRLTEDEEELYFDIDDWFNANLPNPPFYEDGNSVGAVTWFKRSACAEMLERLRPLCDLLTKYGVECVAADSSDPGSVIYEDEFQVGVIPYIRSDPSPAPQDLVLGPTTAGSKRHLGKRGRQRP